MHDRPLQSPPASKRQTSVDRIRASLADDIVRGAIGPGAALDEAGLAERFGVSRTPVREAIRQLEAIGFAEARPHRGAVVPRFTPERLTKMFAVMAEMEALCASYAASSATADGLESLRAAHATCRAAAEEGHLEAYYAANICFHETIYAISGNEFLAEITLNVRNRLTPFRQAQFRATGRLSRSVEEHQAILSAIVAGEPQKAAEAMHEHLSVVRHSVGQVAPALRAAD